MSSHTFSRKSQTVPLIKTKNRLIQTEIPCSGTYDILERLDKYESRSMHGQLPLVWDSASNFNIFDASGNKFIDFTSAIFFSNVGHSNKRVLDYMNKALEKPIKEVEKPASTTLKTESASVRTIINKEVTLPENSSFIYDFDIDIDNDTLGSLEKSLSHISQKLGVSTDDANKLSSKTVESLSSELKYTKTEIESREDDLELLTAEFSKLLKDDK